MAKKNSHTSALPSKEKKFNTKKAELVLNQFCFLVGNEVLWITNNKNENFQKKVYIFFKIALKRDRIRDNIKGLKSENNEKEGVVFGVRIKSKVGRVL